MSGHPSTRPDAGVVGRRIRELRGDRGLSLSALARAAGVGKATLSELEAGRRNPTLDTLYALAAPLGVGLAALIADTTPSIGPAGTARPVVAGSGVTATLLDVVHGPVVEVEVYRLTVEPGRSHRSPGHGPGVLERLTLASGRALVGPDDPGPVEVSAGGSATWSSAGPHSYRALDNRAATGVLVITHEQRRGSPVARREQREPAGNPDRT